jgi:hypothetical protein
VIKKYVIYYIQFSFDNNKMTKNFISPTRVHTNSIESMWRQVKSGIDKNKGVIREYLHSYLDEFC